MILVVVCAALSAAAQTTRIKGRVTDASDGSGIPFAAVFFKGTTVGTSTDLDGYYILEVRDIDTPVICVQILGYESLERNISLHHYNRADFELEMTDHRLNAALVKPDNRRMKRILRNIDANRDRNNPEKRDAYKCGIYSKMELDLSDPGETLLKSSLLKEIDFISDYMDTSALSGKPYLPVLISESRGTRYHTSSPTSDREILHASRISGVNKDNLLQQFTGSMQLRVNMYDTFLDAFNVKIPSPIAAGGNAFYNYYLIDSLNIDGRKTYYIRFHPNKLFTSPVLDGEMKIDTGDWALVEFHGRLVKDRNINWIEDLILDFEYRRLPDGTWFYKKDRFHAEFSLDLTEWSNILSFLGTHEVHYLDPVFEPPTEEESAALKHYVTVESGANDKSEEYWENERPYELSEKEKGIYAMVDSIKTTKTYRITYGIGESLANDHISLGKIAYGPIFNTLSFNNTEGLRVSLGLRTTPSFSKKTRLSGYGAYGFKDHRFKGGGSIEYLFSMDPFRKLTLSGKSDFIQLGRGNGQYRDNSILRSVLSKQKGMRKSPVEEFVLKYQHEWPSTVNSTFSLETRRIFSNEFVPMFTPDGVEISSVQMTQAHLTNRFSWKESVSRGDFKKEYLFTKYPIVTLDVMGTVKGMLNDYGYVRTELTADYRLPLPPAGHSRFTVNAGFITGTVPYPFLKLHAGNSSYIFSRTSFSCMNYYEFASDRWVELFYEHNFGGFFLGHIPLLKKLDLREVFSFKCAWGSLSGRNNGKLGSPYAQDAPMLFPSGMDSLEKPYSEVGFGITNILNVLRVDAIWRLTHRYVDLPDGTRTRASNLFDINIGLEIDF